MAQGNARAVGIDLGRVKPQLARHRTGLGGKCLVGLDHIEIGNFQARALQRRLGGRHRANAHDFGFDARVRVGHQTRQRFQVVRLHGLAGGQHHGRRAVVDARCVAGGDQPVFLEDRLHLGQLLGGHVTAHVLVHLEHGRAFAPRHFHGDDLALEAAFGDCPCGALLALDGQGILVFAADAEPGGHVLGGNAHVEGVERIVKDADHVIEHLGIAHARAPTPGRHQVGAAAHRLGAGADGNFSIAQQQRLRRRHNGLQARTAQTVDVERRRFLGAAGLHGGHTAQIRVARLGGNHRAHHHMPDLVRRDARTTDRLAHRNGGQIGQRHVLE